MPDVLSRILAGAPGTSPLAEEAGRAGGAVAPMPQQPGSAARAGPTIAGVREAALLALLAALTGGHGGALGVGTLIGKLRQAGLEGEVNSWLRAGSPQALHPAVLARAIPPETLDEVEAETGLGREGMLAELARGLPGLVHALTPRGRLPERDAELDGVEEDDLLRPFGIRRSS